MNSLKVLCIKFLEAFQNAGLQSTWKMNTGATVGALICIPMPRILVVS